MLARLILLLTVVPLIELVLLFRIAEEISWGPTILLVIGTGVLGAWLARREGLKVVRRIQDELDRGVPPTSSMVDGLLILVAGALLVTPGVLTDIVGFTLLVPPARARIKRSVADYFRRRVVILQAGPESPGSGPTSGAGADPFVDVEATSRPAGRSGDSLPP